MPGIFEHASVSHDDVEYRIHVVYIRRMFHHEEADHRVNVVNSIRQGIDRCAISGEAST